MKKVKQWHDRALLESAKQQKLYLIIIYVFVGLAAAFIGIMLSKNAPILDVLLVSGSGLVGLSIEKLVNRRIEYLRKQKSEVKSL
ncbi:MAG: hypothetical protein HLX50_00275 [Alteromonadaceae bacterium]|nr:hypothetical protein [Alteromonadaceae bacterium]